MGAVDTVEWTCVLCSRRIQNDWVEQWICIRFCIKLDHSSTETIWMIQKTFGDNAMSTVQIKAWHKQFEDGQESVESDPRSQVFRNKPNTWERWTCTGCNQQGSVTDSARTRTWTADVKTTLSKILMQDLGMKCVMAKFVLRLLLPELKEHRTVVVNDLIQTATNEQDFFKKVITRDESWVYS